MSALHSFFIVFLKACNIAMLNLDKTNTKWTNFDEMVYNLSMNLIVSFSQITKGDYTWEKVLF